MNIYQEMFSQTGEQMMTDQIALEEDLSPVTSRYILVLSYW